MTSRSTTLTRLPRNAHRSLQLPLLSSVPSSSSIIPSVTRILYSLPSSSTFLSRSAAVPYTTSSTKFGPPSSSSSTAQQSPNMNTATVKITPVEKSNKQQDSKYPSFSRALFSGELLSGSVYPYPEVLTVDQKETLHQLVEPFDKFLTDNNDAAKNDETASIPPEVMKQLGELGAYGLQVPETLSGIGLSNTGYARLTEIIGGHDLGLGIHLGAHQSIGFKGILLFGTPAQKEKYLPDLATGKQIAAFALTEPSTGSDANSVKTRAKLGSDGKWYLTGSKLWISNGGQAEIFTVFAQTEVDDPKNPGSKKDKVTAFIVERKFGGVTNGPPEKKMGIKCSNTAEVYFDNTPIPPENVIGEVGGGFKVAMEILNNGRFGMGAALTGTMKSVLKGVTEHANNRVQFGRKIREYGSIKGKIATMTARAYAAESLAYMLAANMDRGMTDYQIEAAASKVFASDAAWYVADEGIQIMGGLGFMRSLPYERIQRDLRIFRIFEGTNDILKLMIAGTGLQALAKTMEPVQKALKSPLSNVGTLVPFGVTLAKSRLGIVDTPSMKWVPNVLRPAADIVEKGTGQFGDVCRSVLMKYGKHVIEQQLVLEKIADVAIDLTATTAAISRATKAINENSPSAPHEIEIVNLFATEAGQRIRNNLIAIQGGNGQSTINKLKTTVADTVFNAGGYSAKHPLGV